jgi:hypothetical protein
MKEYCDNCDEPEDIASTCEICGASLCFVCEKPCQECGAIICSQCTVWLGNSKYECKNCNDERNTKDEQI